jgi:hypothetical protein
MLPSSALFTVDSLPLKMSGECEMDYLQQDDGVLKEGPEDEEDAADDPRLHRVQPVRLRGVGRRRVEDVDLF